MKDKFMLTGADQAAYDRVFEMGRGKIESILQDPDLLISQKLQQLAEAKCKLQESLKASGFLSCGRKYSGKGLQTLPSATLALHYSCQCLNEMFTS